ncbi:hypothetical protein CWATWH0402_5667 [Crocosphaera watsonii WH 0402]|uniref:Uncharacterized protein n=3 Tax=Crocosphaera watsonii TaxID=263511 RepID=T2JZ85_CROWT|nr:MULTISPECIES: hypothetical protein [Crocosphaera]EHJ09255.1 hypothetical protein CWATWH0003_B314 [Crocosphaera watsonii WH 0003]CCQ59397.1 hypothetical protein CWATWH0005_5165 [Crocosphaera watsonii WH 0005]CCQ70374.1 hypothetical protein CWATWH0402_5667 [Crocosphaera watsonii WH 0402]
MIQNQLEKNIIEKLGLSRTRIAKFCQKWGIIELSLFGSILGNQFSQDSEA